AWSAASRHPVRATEIAYARPGRRPRRLRDPRCGGEIAADRRALRSLGSVCRRARLRARARSVWLRHVGVAARRPATAEGLPDGGGRARAAATARDAGVQRQPRGEAAWGGGRVRRPAAVR